MPLINEIYDSLPYIDPDPTPTQRTEILSLLQLELEVSNTDTSLPHPSLPDFPPDRFSDGVKVELARLENDESSKMLGGVDLSRYEMLEKPVTPITTTKTKSKSKSKSKSNSKSKKEEDKVAEKYKEILCQAYISHEYLSDRIKNLSLLEQFGKNAWLVGNDGLEQVLKVLEKELEEAKRGIDVVVGEREGRQRGVEGEVKGMEGGWRRGVGRVVEGSLGVGGVEEEVRRWRREMGGGGGEKGKGDGDGGEEGSMMDVDG